MLASMRRVVASLLVSALVLPLGAAASQIQNGDFEAGNFGGWKLFQYGAALTPTTSDWPPISGNYSALVLALSGLNIFPSGLQCKDDVWNVNCPEPLFRYTGDGTPLTYPYFVALPLDPLELSVLPRGGGAIGQDVVVSAGDVLSWDWRCVDQLPECAYFPPFPQGDVGWFFARNATVAYTMVTAVKQVQSASFVFPQPGLWSVYFGVAQGYNDSFGWSALQLDNVVMREVPEPGTVVILSLGLAGLAFTRRRKR